MSEIDYERVQFLHDVATECARDGTEIALDADEVILYLTEPLLALRERAEPVAYRYRFRPTREAAGKWILVDTLEEANPLPKYEIQPLYTAPPAPVAAGWIACSERLPKIGDEIFYYCEDDGIRDCGIVSSSNFTGRGDAELFVHAEGYDLRFGADITHWMPLPEAPGKEG
ncbi:DUF551 domain-containing protein [Cronobacter sakazakii]